LHLFVKKVSASLSQEGPGAAHFAMVRFGDLRCRQGLMAAWPLVQPHLDQLSPEDLSDAIWAASSIPKPPSEVVRDLGRAASFLAPRLRELPADELPQRLYRCLYGLARLSGPSHCQDFRRRAEKMLEEVLQSRGPCPWLPSQLVRLLWSLGRLGCKEAKIFDALEPRLRDVSSEFSDRELEALYGILTDLHLFDQWQLIHDVERAMEARHESKPGDPNKAPRKSQFRRKWTRANPMTHSAAPRSASRRRFCTSTVTAASMQSWPGLVPE